MYLLNLWLAGRIARTSHRLRRPWPDLHSIELPQTAIVVLAAALLLSFAGGLLALIAQIVGAALLTAYTLVGFAVLHAVTQSSSGRFWWRLAAYGADRHVHLAAAARADARPARRLRSACAGVSATRPRHPPFHPDNSTNPN